MSHLGELRPLWPPNTGVGRGWGGRCRGGSRKGDEYHSLEGPAPLLSGSQEKPGRATLGGALEIQLSPLKTRECQR